MLFWVARLCFRPRPALFRTPVDPWLFGFFVLTFLTALTSYNPEVSIGKLRAASLFTVVYVVAQNVRSPALLRALALTLVASCALGLVHTFAVYARGRGVKLQALTADSPLRAARFIEGDAIISVDGAEVGSPAEVVDRIEQARPTTRERVLRHPDGKPACRWDETTACVRVYRAEALPAANVAREGLPPGATAGGAARHRGMVEGARRARERVLRPVPDLRGGLAAHRVAGARDAAQPAPEVELGRGCCWGSRWRGCWSR